MYKSFLYLLLNTLIFSSPAFAGRQDVLASVNLIHEPVWHWINDQTLQTKDNKIQSLTHRDRVSCLQLIQHQGVSSSSRLVMMLNSVTGLIASPYDGIGIKSIGNSQYFLNLHLADKEKKTSVKRIKLNTSNNWTTSFYSFSEFSSASLDKILNKEILDKELITAISISHIKVSQESEAPESDFCISDLYLYTSSDI